MLSRFIILMILLLRVVYLLYVRFSAELFVRRESSNADDDVQHGNPAVAYDHAIDTSRL